MFNIGAYASNHELAVDAIRDLIENKIDGGIYYKHFTEGAQHPYVT